MAVIGAFALSIAIVAEAPASADASTRNLWAVTRDRTGHLHVVRGAQAAITAMDNRLDRPSDLVLTSEEDATVHTMGLNDPLRGDQWALNRVDYEGAWGIANGSGVKVAVIDTGVLGDHEDLAGSVLPGIDLADDADSVDPAHTGMVDPGGHGTHVAGIIAAHPNNHLGIAGAAPGVKIVPVRVLNASGSGSTAAVAQGIIWAADHGIRVVNMSLGGGPSPGIETAMQYALSKGTVSFAAAGNSYAAGNPPVYPAAYPEAIAVGAIDSTGHHAAFSEVGSYVDVAAPGDYIWSTYGLGRTQYAIMSGTSMATPYAAAVGALVLSENPSISAADLTHAVEAGTTDLGAPGRDNVYGFGLVNPRLALEEASSAQINKGAQGDGYWIVTAGGRVYGYGVRTYGDLGGRRLSAPVIAAARTSTGRGYWLATADGGVYPFGDAPYLGSMRGRHLNQPIVGMAATPSGYGYTLLGRDGGIFGFGNAHFYGSTGGIRLNAPVLDMTMTGDGRGYWFVAADGGIFGYGDAQFHGSTARIHLAKPVKSMTASVDGSGYWMVADDGGIFGFNVPFKGSLPSVRSLYNWPYVPSVRMRALPSNQGYYLLGLNGTVWAFGNAKYFGSVRTSWAVDLMLAR